MLLKIKAVKTSSKSFMSTLIDILFYRIPYSSRATPRHLPSLFLFRTSKTALVGLASKQDPPRRAASLHDLIAGARLAAFECRLSDPIPESSCERPPHASSRNQSSRSL